MLKVSWFPANAVNIWKREAELGLSRFCSSLLHEDVKALDAAVFPGDGEGGQMDLLGKPVKTGFSNMNLLHYESRSSACPTCSCDCSISPTILPCRVDTPLHPLLTGSSLKPG